MMSSVAKDLRIMIVDSVGQLVTGTPFQVTVQGAGKYTDSDEDGSSVPPCPPRPSFCFT